jgi:hypothetical protein
VLSLATLLLPHHRLCRRKSLLINPFARKPSSLLASDHSFQPTPNSSQLSDHSCSAHAQRPVYCQASIIVVVHHYRPIGSSSHRFNLQQTEESQIILSDVVVPSSLKTSKPYSPRLANSPRLHCSSIKRQPLYQSSTPCRHDCRSILTHTQRIFLNLPRYPDSQIISVAEALLGLDLWICLAIIRNTRVDA